MIQKLMFDTYEDMLHFLTENQPEQFAVLRHNESEIELCYRAVQEDQPVMA